MNDLHEWFQKNDLCPENILYLYRNDRKTVVHRMDGEEVALYAPLHSVLSALPEDMFLNISKGIVVCRSQIVDISNDGIYTMSDGRSFQGRRRGLSDHRRLRAEIRRVDAQLRPMSMSLLEKCSLLDDMPLAFCIIELVFNEDGHGVDFIFRYCNAEMATIEGVPVEESTVALAPMMVASVPSSPVSPFGPCGPVAPVAPVSPCGPVSPWGPVSP